MDIIINLILYEHLQQQYIHVVADRAFQTLRAHLRHCYRRILAGRIFAVFYDASGGRGRKRTVRRVRLLQTALIQGREAAGSKKTAYCLQPENATPDIFQSL